MTTFSSEKSVCKLLPLNAEQTQNPEEFGNVDYFCIRVIPVLGNACSFWAVYGSVCAFATWLAKRSTRKRSHDCLVISATSCTRSCSSEHVLFNEGHKKIELEKDEVEFVYQEIWRGRSFVGEVKNGGHDRLYLARRRTDRPLYMDNIMHLTTKKLAILVKDDIMGFDPEVVARIDARLYSLAVGMFVSRTILPLEENSTVA